MLADSSEKYIDELEARAAAYKTSAIMMEMAVTNDPALRAAYDEYTERARGLAKAAIEMVPVVERINKIRGGR